MGNCSTDIALLTMQSTDSTEVNFPLWSHQFCTYNLMAPKNNVAEAAVSTAQETH